MNLRISKLEVRNESSVDVVGCFHQRRTHIFKTDLPEAYLAARDAVSENAGRAVEEASPQIAPCPAGGTAICLLAEKAALGWLGLRAGPQ